MKNYNISSVSVQAIQSCEFYEYSPGSHIFQNTYRGSMHNSCNAEASICVLLIMPYCLCMGQS